ncbi:piggyBac transposable element-derived protein 4-like [Sycon ciliatum]|uniref:piggyBac transposable element-derived protein 4-like n=1 Tax=Sycon ciliatum TaxID=27933 RepID=UPI0031F60C8C
MAASGDRRRFVPSVDLANAVDQVTMDADSNEELGLDGGDDDWSSEDESAAADDIADDVFVNVDIDPVSSDMSESETEDASDESDGGEPGDSAKSHVLFNEVLQANDDGSEGDWKKAHNTPYNPAFTAQPGLQVPVPPESSPYDYVNLFLTDAFWDLLVNETNRYAAQFIAAHPNLPRRSRYRDWYDVDVGEMKVFLSVHLLMGLLWKPEVDLYWNKKNQLIYTPSFPAAMKRDRWAIIMSFLHFADNASAAAAGDKLRKIRPLLTLLGDRFSSVYTMEKNISIDEELIPWKGRLDFKQYIPSKRSRFGVKSFAICETSGYMAGFSVYVGSEAGGLDADIVRQIGKSGAVVERLIRPYLNKGYRLFVDNFYSSVELLDYLETRGTAVCGTVRKNRKSLPKRVVTTKLRTRGNFLFRSRRSALLVKLLDSKDVYILTNMFEPTVTSTGKRDLQRKVIKKLTAIQHYNKHMGGVDRNDQLLSHYSALRKTVKWYRKVATHFIEVAVLNAYILYKKQGGKRRHHEFLSAVFTAMMRDGKTLSDSSTDSAQEPASPASATPVTTPAAATPVTTHAAATAAAADAVVAPAAAAAAAVAAAPPAMPRVVEDRLTGRHFPSLVPGTLSKPAGKAQKRCIVCQSKRPSVRRDTTVCCKSCASMPGLCVSPCFELYHTKEKY